MRYRYITVHILAIFLILISSDITALAKNIESFSDEITVSVEEISAEDHMPVGGWAPIEGYRVEEDTAVKRSAIFRSRNIYNATVDSVFSKGAGTVGYDSLSKTDQRTYYLQINAEATKFMEAVDDLSPTPMNLSSGIEDVYVVATLNYVDLGLTEDEAFQAFCAYEYDHPAYYWISNHYCWSGTSIYMCTEEEYASVSYRNSINNMIINGVQRYVALTDKVDDTLDKIAVLHDQIVTDVDYAYQEDGTTAVTEKWAHSVQGVFDPAYSEAVCEGYASAFSLVMNYLDIPNYYIVGNAGTGSVFGGHAWNAVSYDGGETYMYMDLTWDDLGKDVGFFYKYFGMPSSDFESTHIANKPTNTGSKWLYELKGTFNDELSGTYYSMGGFYCSSDDYDDFAKTIHTKAYRFGTVLTFLADDEETVVNIIKKLKLSRYNSITVSYLNNEYYIAVVKDIPEVDLSDAGIILEDDICGYTGEAVEPDVEEVSLYGIKLIKDINYTVSYDNNVDLGEDTAQAIISGIGNFTGSAVKGFSILNSVIENEKVSLSETKYTYDGNEKKPDVIAKYGGKLLTEGTDYTVQYSDNMIDAGRITVTVIGTGEYHGTVEKTYVIAPKSISDFNLSIEDGVWTYDGSAKEPKVLSLKDGNDVIDAENYTITYDNNVNAGNEAEVIVTGIGNYSDSCSALFTINPKEITITALDQTVLLNEVIDGSVDMALLEGALDNHKLAGIDYITSGTEELTDDGIITPCNPVIKYGDIDVTANYNIKFVAGVLTVIHNHDIDYVNEIAATCDADGVKAHYKCSICNKIFEDVEGTDEITDEDTLVIKRGHKASKAVRENEVAATCIAEGTYDEVVYCSVCDEELSRTSGTIQKLGHDYDITYELSDDGKKCTAKAVCKREGCSEDMAGHVVTETVDTTSVVKTPATTETKGTTTYSAEFENELFEAYTEDVNDIPIIESDDPDPESGDSPTTGETEETNPESGDKPTTGDTEETDPESGDKPTIGETEETDPESGDKPTIGETEETDPESGDKPTIGETEETDPESSDKPTSGEGDKPTTGETEETDPESGDKPTTGETEETDPESGDKPATGETEETNTESGGKPATGETEETNPESGDKPATGETEVTDPVSSDKPITGEGDKPTTGKTEVTDPGNTDKQATGEGETSSTEEIYTVISYTGDEPIVEFNAVTVSSEKTVIIPDSVVIDGITYKVSSVSDNAFKDNKVIEEVVLNGNIESIGANAFSGCTNLKQITIPSSVKKIGANAFSGCKKLKSVVIGANVTSIGKKAFYGCKSLRKITIKTTKLKKKTIGKNAFKGIYKKATFKCPKKKLSNYKKWIKKSGAPKKAKYKKL